MEKIEKLLCVRRTNYRKGIIITSKNIFELSMESPYYITTWFDPANYQFVLKHSSEELEPNSKEYKEIINKFIELKKLMDIEI